MGVFLIYIATYFIIPFIAIKITGRMITWQGWLFLMFLWPIVWLFLGPEELP